MNHERISKLLSQAAAAHHVFEETVLKGVPDQEWPDWYAAYVIENRMNELLPQPVAVPQLGQFLAESNQRYEQAGKPGTWAEFTAADLVSQFGRA